MITWKDERTLLVTLPDGSGRVLSFSTPSLAENAAAAIALGLADDEPLLFGHFVERWLTYHVAPELAVASIRTYDSQIHGHLLPEFGHMPLSEITTDVVLRFIADMQNKGLTNRHITNLVNTLSSILGKAEKWQYIERNPVARIDALFLGTRPDRAA